MTVAAAHVALKQLAQVAGALPEATHDEALGWFLQVAATGTVKEVRALTKQVVAKYGDETLSRREEIAQNHEELRWYETPSGHVRFEALFSPAHGAILAEVITSISGPCQTMDENGHPMRDVRSAGKRRADALIELVTNAKRHAQAAESTTGMAPAEVAGAPLLSMLVTVDFEDLKTTPGVSRQGFGKTNLGDYIDPGMLRRYACDADIIPVVLGTKSEPLDVGRTRRLFTNRQRYALASRDQGCTFPGCERPPSWCEAHHLVPWSCDGASDLSNAALLCERHHMIVHVQGYLGRIDDDTKRVVWDRAPGAIPTNNHRRAS